MHIEIGVRLWNGAWLSQANEFKVVQLADGDILLVIGGFNLPDVICSGCHQSCIFANFLNYLCSNLILIQNWSFSSTWSSTLSCYFRPCLLLFKLPILSFTHLELFRKWWKHEIITRTRALCSLQSIVQIKTSLVSFKRRSTDHEMVARHIILSLAHNLPFLSTISTPTSVILLLGLSTFNRQYIHLTE